MPDAYSLDDLIDFLDHAGDRGLVPAATAQALAVATRNVLGVLSDNERADLSNQDLDGIIKRFNNKRAKDFNPSSLKEYGRRVHRAVDLFLRWREDPANFAVKTRVTGTGRKKAKSKESTNGPSDQGADAHGEVDSLAGTYNSAIPVRPGTVITLANIPHDLTKAEAERLANFVRMLALGSGDSS